MIGQEDMQMEHKGMGEELIEDQAAGEDSERSRRDFITKLVTTAGVIAAASLAASASADERLPSPLEVKVQKDWSTAFVKLGKVRNGFSVVVAGSELGMGLKQAGLLPATADLSNARITIEFTAG
jgi:hypothetical protein